MKRLDIKISFHCNNHGRHCVQGRKRTLSRYRTTRQLKETMRQARADCDEIAFVEGIKNLKALDKRVIFNTVITKPAGRPGRDRSGLSGDAPARLLGRLDGRPCPEF